MDKSYPLSSPMVVQSLDVKNDPFRSHDEEEELLGPETKWLRLRVWLKVLRIGRLLYAHVIYQQRSESRDRGMRTKLRWSKRKLVLDLGSQYLSRDDSVSCSSPDCGVLAASLTIDCS